MLYVRFKAGIAERLGPRLMEWEHAVLLVGFGLVLLEPEVLLPGVPGENAIGSLIFMLGSARLIGLIINGLLKRTTSWLRALSAIASSFLFVLIWIGYLYAGRWGAAVVFLPVVALFELFNYARAMRDVGRVS